MTHKMPNLRPALHPTCAWRLTGDTRTPLTCVWTTVAVSTPTRIAPLPAETDVGGMRLCA